MSLTAAFFVFLAVWLAIGLLASLVMGRRGHEPFVWGVLGVGLGPLVIPLALGSIRRERLRAVTLGGGSRGTGPVDVLVGLDGSPEATATLRAVIDLLGRRQIGRLVLARVIDYDSAAGELADDEPRTRAMDDLRRGVEVGTSWLGRPPGRALLAGVPAVALETHAREDGFDVLAVGSRGRGASKLAFGSVASRLARGTAVPVIIMSAGPAPNPGDGGESGRSHHAAAPDATAASSP